MKLYVGNVSFSVTEADLRAHFSPFALASVSIPVHPDTGRPRGFAFVEIADEEAAEGVVEKFHGTELGGRTITVAEAMKKPRKKRKGHRGGKRKRQERQDRE